MIKRIFLTLGLLMVACTSLRAGELSTKISLGIRDTNRITKVAFPLAFRIENSGKTAIEGDHIADIFAKGIIHALPKNGQEELFDLKKVDVSLRYGLVPNDLQPGATEECKLVGNLLTFFPSAKDGVYQVWWTLGESKSNTLHFTVSNGKVSYSPLPDPKFTD